MNKETVIALIQQAGAVAVVIIPCMFAFFQSQNKKSKQLNHCIEIIFYDKIEQLYEMYIHKGYCPITKKKSANKFYNICKAQGWEEEVRYMYDTIMKLPDKKCDKIILEEGVEEYD